VCHALESDAAGGGHAIVRSFSAYIQLIDGRPLVIPWSGRASLDCSGWVLPSGGHSAHVSYQVAGRSPLVSQAWASLKLDFVLEAGREYEIDCTGGRFQGVRCWVEDELSGERVAYRHSPENDWEAFAAIVKAYAACGDEKSWENLDSLRRSGRIGDSWKDLEIGECRPLLDLR
jgi:hypothetical protein